jgi:hypothetical protein
MHLAVVLSLPVAALVLGLAACAPLPAGPDAELTGLPLPTLLPLDDVLAQAGTVAPTVDPGLALSARAARLKARAALMQGPVHDPATRARLAEAIRQGRA